MRTFGGRMLSLVLAAVAAATPVELPPLDDPDDPGASSIWGGRRADEPALDAIVALQTRDRRGTPGHTFCSGVLVAPAWVLTAAHCLPDVERWLREGWGVAAALGPDGHRLRVDLDRVVLHPAYAPTAAAGRSVDVGLAHLARDVDGVEPMRLSETALTDAWVGLPVTAVGYGVTASDREDDGTRRAADLFLAGVDGSFLRLFDGSAAWDPDDREYEETAWDATSNVCFGDSGGGVLAETDGGFALLGLVSIAYPACEHGGTGAVRVDNQRAWIATHVEGVGTAELPPAEHLHGDAAWPGGAGEVASADGARALGGCATCPPGLVPWPLLGVLAATRRRRPTPR